MKVLFSRGARGVCPVNTEYRSSHCWCRRIPSLWAARQLTGLWITCVSCQSFYYLAFSSLLIFKCFLKIIVFLFIIWLVAIMVLLMTQICKEPVQMLHIGKLVKELCMKLLSLTCFIRTFFCPGFCCLYLCFIWFGS